MIRSRPVTARIRWTASIVASVPELAKRHSGRPNRRVSSSATTRASVLGWAEGGAPAPGVAARLDDRRVGGPGQGHPVPAVQVHVLIAVDVVDLGPPAMAEPDRLRLGDLPARGDTARQGVLRTAGQ